VITLSNGTFLKSVISGSQ